MLTGGGTEADNLAVKGAARAARDAGTGDGVVTTAFEHKGVLAAADRLERDGFRVRRVGVDRRGLVDLDALAAALDTRTVVVSVMLVNNEVGTIQPLDEIAGIVRGAHADALLHTDAVQAVSWVDVAARAAAADLVAISAHKFGGPKGTGALVVRGSTVLEPLVEGGGQERGLRSGTVNVAGAVAMAAALDETVAARPTEVPRIAALRDRLVDGLLAAVPDAFENGVTRAQDRGQRPRRVHRGRGRGVAGAARPGRGVGRGRLVVLVGRNRAVARARCHGHRSERRASRRSG